MSKHQEALKIIDELAQESPNGHRYLRRHYNALKELVDEKTEHESRKDKLIVGSEWECVAETLAPISSYYIDPLDKKVMAIQKSRTVNVVQIGEQHLKVQYKDKKCFLSKEQFLMCFKPIVRNKQVMKISPEGDISIPLKDKEGNEHMIPLQEIYDSLDLIKEMVIKEIRERF